MMIDMTMAASPPTIVPSQVLPGLTDGARLRLPRKLPAK